MQSPGFPTPPIASSATLFNGIRRQRSAFEFGASGVIAESLNPSSQWPIRGENGTELVGPKQPPP
jgi:hypothetical protein